MQNHIVKFHSNLNLNEHKTSTFFNLINTLNLNLSNESSQNSSCLLPDDFYIYQCLNCRLFFASNCSFSHNCWTYTESSNGDQKHGDQKQPMTNNNYFSPIFLKFNVSKVLNSRLTSPLCTNKQSNESDLNTNKNNKNNNNNNKNNTEENDINDNILHASINSSITLSNVNNKTQK
jgi:hypothetical protein